MEERLLPILGQGSNIVLISSLAARSAVGKPDFDNRSILVYASTKGAIETLVKNFAAILGPRGIRVNAVAPGVIETDMANFRKDRRRPRGYAWNASIEANRQTRGCRRRSRAPCLGRGALGHRAQYPGRRWIETLEGAF